MIHTLLHWSDAWKIVVGVVLVGVALLAYEWRGHLRYTTSLSPYAWRNRQWAIITALLIAAVLLFLAAGGVL